MTTDLKDKCILTNVVCDYQPFLNSSRNFTNENWLLCPTCLTNKPKNYQSHLHS